MFSHRMLLVLFTLVSCSQPQYSPWQTDLPSHKKNNTAKNLERLIDLEESDDLEAFRIAILGDPQGTPGDLRKIVRRLNDIPDLRFMMVLGDLTDYGLKHEYEWAYDALEKSKIPYFTAVGNHDAISHGKSLYKQMFGDFNYTFDYEGYKFVVWNNNKNEFGDSNFPWLKQQIGPNSVVASHVPPLEDVHTLGEIDYWTELYLDANIVTSMHGHRGTHDHYEFDMGDQIPTYVVAKAKGLHYALVTFDPILGVSYESCVDVCESMK